MAAERDIRRRPQTSVEEAERIRDIGFLLGLVGFASFAFVVGRNTSPGKECCNKLINRDLELLLCETGLAVQSQQQGWQNEQMPTAVG